MSHVETAGWRRLLGGLVMITLRRQADKPVVVRPAAAADRPAPSGPRRAA